MRALGAALALLAVAACVRPSRPVAVDPEAVFAAYRRHGGFTVDRLPGGGTGELHPPGWIRRPGAPTFVLDAGDGTRAALRVLSPSRVVVRDGSSGEGRDVGEVTATWEGGAIQLVLTPTGAQTVRSDPFARQGVGTGPSVLRRDVTTILDVRGAYRAALRTPDGATVGWLQVRNAPYDDAPRRYEARLPDGVPPALAAAAVILVDGEIDWIENHAVNVYRGDGGGPLQQSVPLPR